MTTSTLTIYKKAWRLGFTLSLSRLVNMITSFIGMLMVARLGHAELATSALISATQGNIFVISISFLFSVGVVVGNTYGAKHYSEIGKVLQQGWILATLIAIPACLIAWEIGPILHYFGQQPALIHLTTQYFHIYFFAIPALLWMITCQQFVLAVNQQRFVLLMSLLGLILSVSFSYGFIYGRLGLPRLGVAGLAYAYVIQGWVLLLAYLVFCYYNPLFKEFKLFHRHQQDYIHYLKKLFTIGWPISVQAAGDLLSFFALTIMTGWLSINALAAQQVVMQYFLLLVIPVLAIAQSSSILVGQARGSGNYQDIKRYSNATLTIGLGFTLLIIIAFVFFPETLIELYIGKSQELSPYMEHIASIVLILTGLRLFFDAVVEIKTGSLRGLYDTKFPMVAGLIVTWVLGIPLAYFFGFTLNWGLIGITCSGIISMVLSAGVIYWRWLEKSRQAQIIEQHFN